MSRTIGYVISPTVSASIGTGPTLIIWWTAGVSGIAAPAIAAIRGLQTPAGDDHDVRLEVALVGPDAGDVPVLDVDAGDLGHRREAAAPRAPGRARA